MTKVKSAFSGKDVVSIVGEPALWGEPFKIYSQEEWKSDAWDPMEYGRDVDFGKPFFEQYAALQKAVPRMALISLANENSEYTTGTAYCKNCYLINSSENCEDCYYGKLLQKCKNSVDCHYLYGSELCYECFSVYDSYDCQYLSFSQNCQDCLFSSNLRSCKHCCLCTNLEHKEYHFLNKPLPKEEYEQRVRSIQGNFQRTEEMKKLWKDMMRSMIRKYTNIVNGENCSGDYIENSRNCLDCYDVNESEDCRHVYVGVNVKDNYHCSNMYLKPELCYDTLGTIEVYNAAYCIFIFHSKNLLYCDYCFSCEDCFGCSGLTRKKHCIFNKQYTKEQYDALVPKIIEHMKRSGEWGLFLPGKFSLFGYNETVAQEYYPLSKEAALKKGFHWRETDTRNFKPQTVPFPSTIAETTDAITRELLCCEQCGKNYRIVPQELQFYRQNQIAPPRQCPDCRYDQRMTLRNPRTLWDRACAKCTKPIRTSYAPERPEIVYCEKCYLATVY
jgi:hypothetical protein